MLSKACSAVMHAVMLNQTKACSAPTKHVSARLRGGEQVRQEVRGDWDKRREVKEEVGVAGERVW